MKIRSFNELIRQGWLAGIFLCGVFCAGLAVAEPESNEDSPEAIQAMSQLVQESIKPALDVIKQGKTFFPYAVYIDKETGSNLIGLNQEKKIEPMQAAALLFQRLHKLAVDNPNMMQAAILLPFEGVDPKTGKVRQAIRAEVDHRDAAPKIVIIPYVIDLQAKQIKLEKPIYAEGTNAIFETNPT